MRGVRSIDPLLSLPIWHGSVCGHCAPPYRHRYIEDKKIKPRIHLLNLSPCFTFVTSMRSLVSFAALLSIVQAVSIPGLLGRASQDSCGAVNAPLKVTIESNTLITVGDISAFLAFCRVPGMGGLTLDEDACLCLSDIPNFITTNSIASAAAALVGRASTTNALTTLVVSDFNWLID